MPLFEFTCAACGHVFEELLSASEAGEGKVPCPACGARKARKGFSSFATGSSGGSAGSALPAGGGCGRGGFT